MLIGKFLLIVLSLWLYEFIDDVDIGLFWWFCKEVYIFIVILISCFVFRIFVFVCLDA
jgi:hypothetical protein